MPNTLSTMAIGNDFIKRIDRFLFTLPKMTLGAGILSIQALLFFASLASGPWVPLGIFTLLNLYFATKYVGGRFAYLLAFIAAAGKTYIKIGFYPDDAHWWQGQWQFVSSLSINVLFCYLINGQLRGRIHAEQALDKLSRLNEAIVSQADSGVMVFKDDGQCLISNTAAARILGSSAERLRSLNYRNDETWPVPDLLAAGLEAMRTGQDRKFTSKLCTVEGRDVWCAVSATRIRRAATAYLLLVFTDISAYKQAEDARQRADKETAVALARAGMAERKLLTISEETQERIGRELHDDLGQHLMGVAFLSEVLFQKLKDAGNEEMHDASRITLLVNEAMSRTRLLAHGLYPDELGEKGLCQMMEKFAGFVEGIYKIECDVFCQAGCRIDDPEVAINLFRIVQEAVANAVKHGQARQILLRLTNTRDQQVLVEILDDGNGISNVPTADGLGMRSMRYRSELIGAALEIEPRRSGGTRVAVSLPAVN